MSTTTTVARRAWTPRTRAAIFYVAVSALLLLIMTKHLADLLPARLASQIGHNSESLLYALLVCATIQVVRSHRPPTSRSWLVATVFAAACLALAAGLNASDLPSSVVTLNEPLVAAGLTALYVNLPRPVRWPWAWSGVVLVLVVVFFDTQVVLDQAESLVPLMIAPIALDVVDRALLEPDQPDRPGRRLAWCGCLVGVALFAMVVASAVRPDLSGAFDYGVDYAQRAAEAYWGWLLIHVYLGFWLPWVRRGQAVVSPAPGAVGRAGRAGRSRPRR